MKYIKRVWGLACSCALFMVSQMAYAGFGVHIGKIHITPPHISPPPIPHIIPTVVTKAVDNVAKAGDKVVNDVANAGGKAISTGTSAATSAMTMIGAPAVLVSDVATGKPILPAAGSALATTAKGIQGLAEAASKETGTIDNLKVSVVQDTAGDDAATVMQINTGSERYSAAFVVAATGALTDPKLALSAPLAAAMRAAHEQYAATAQPLPDHVKQALAATYPADVLNNAKYAIGGLSLALPDLIEGFQRSFFGDEYAVTVGNIMVFAEDPGQNYHWWAHELDHTVQYATWGIDTFAYKYVTGCAGVENAAENKAQSAVPLIPPVDASKLCPRI